MLIYNSEIACRVEIVECFLKSRDKIQTMKAFLRKKSKLRKPPSTNITGLVVCKREHISINLPSKPNFYNGLEL